MEPSWEQLLEVERMIQQYFPECVLVGGTAAALHAHHRVSFDVDSVMTDLRARFPSVLDRLESLAGWKTRRIRPPVLILGHFQGVDVGIRQLIRQIPLETVEVNGITIPTTQEMLRVKGWLIITRNALRDYLDYCALADIVGDGFNAAMASMDFYYPQPPDCDTATQQLAKQLAEPLPYDYVPDRDDLTAWRGLKDPWVDWEYDKAYCRRLAGQLMELLLDGDFGGEET